MSIFEGSSLYLGRRYEITHTERERAAAPTSNNKKGIFKCVYDRIDFIESALVKILKFSVCVFICFYSQIFSLTFYPSRTHSYVYQATAHSIIYLCNKQFAVHQSKILEFRSVEISQSIDIVVVWCGWRIQSSRRKRKLWVYSIQLNPIQLKIQSNPILSIGSQPHSNNFRYFEIANLYTFATQRRVNTDRLIEVAGIDGWLDWMGRGQKGNGDYGGHDEG